MCWENFMPLARYALYAQGLEIHIAPTYDSGDGWIGTLQHIAREGMLLGDRQRDGHARERPPRGFPERDRLYADADEWINEGDSVSSRPAARSSPARCARPTGMLLQKSTSTPSGGAAAHRRGRALRRPDVFQLQRQPAAAVARAASLELPVSAPFIGPAGHSANRVLRNSPCQYPTPLSIS
jgi:nitrilase